MRDVRAYEQMLIDNTFIVRKPCSELLPGGHVAVWGEDINFTCQDAPAFAPHRHATRRATAAAMRSLSSVTGDTTLDSDGESFVPQIATRTLPHTQSP